MPVKRPVDDDAGPPMPPKHSRQDLHSEYDPNASLAATARRKGASNRTGQACDRCKVRSRKNARGMGKNGRQKETERDREAMGGTQRRWKPMTRDCNTTRDITTDTTLHRSVRYAATRNLEAARPAPRTTPNAAPQTASPASPGLAATPRASRARTRVCARTLTACRNSSRIRA
jgi:hypothetical protein